MVLVWIIILILIIVSLIILYDILRKWSRLSKEDKSPLDIHTFDGLNSPYHPSVLYFENGWNGWKYWMAETPFSRRSKPCWDRNECPSIHVSNDGINWEIPEALASLLKDSDGFDIMSGKDDFIDEKGNYLRSTTKDEVVEGNGERLISDLLLHKRSYCIWRQIIRKECIDLSIFETDPKIKKGEDMLAMLALAKNIRKFKGIDKVIYYYRWYSGNTSHQKVDMVDVTKRIADRILDIFKDNNYRKNFIGQLNSLLINYYLVCHADKDINKSNMAKFIRDNVMHIQYLTKRERAALCMLYIPSAKIRKAIFSTLYHN